MPGQAVAGREAAAGGDLQKAGSGQQHCAWLLRGAASASAARDGFLIAIMNPKIALFFLALFSQFVRPDAGMTEKAIMAATAGVIDALWYIIVAVVLSHSIILEWLRARACLLDRLFGLILIALAIRVAL